MTAKDKAGALLPYAGTSGWSGSDTSRERAERADDDGTTRDRQFWTLHLLSNQRSHGLTWKELSFRTGWHHGQASGVLSVLHLEGRIRRLDERRDRCAVYVLPQWVEDRPQSPRRAPRWERLAARLGDLAADLRAEGHDDCADAILRAVEGTRR